MPCSLESPCGGLRRVILVTPDFWLEECLNGHSIRHGAAPPVIANPRSVAQLTSPHRRCGWMGCIRICPPSRHRCRKHRGLGRGARHGAIFLEPKT